MKFETVDTRAGLFAGVLAILLAAFSPLYAFHFQKGGEIYLSGDFTEDVMLAGTTVNFDGTVVGDLLSASRILTFDGVLDGNLNAAAQRITVNGEVRRSVRAFAEVVNINSRIDGDLVTFASEITFSGESAVVRDIAVFGNEVFLDGTVGSDAYVYANTINISGRIEGNLKVNGNKISIAPGAYVGGDFSYESKEKANISPDAQVMGETRWKKRTSDGEGMSLFVPPPKSLLWTILFLIGSIIIGGLMLLIRRDLVAGVVDEIRYNGAIAGVLGIAVIFLVPVMLVLTAITLVGIPVALAGLTIYGFLFLVGRAIVAIAVGAFILEWMRKGKRVSFGWALVIGSMLMALLFKVPYLGWLVYIVVWGLGAGAIVTRTFRRKTPPPHADAAATAANHT